MNFIVNADIPVPESVLKEHKRQLHYWYQHHKTETRVEPYQFYYDGHLVTLAFDTCQEPSNENRMVRTSVVLSSLVLVATISILTYYVY